MSEIFVCRCGEKSSRCVSCLDQTCNMLRSQLKAKEEEIKKREDEYRKLRERSDEQLKAKEEELEEARDNIYKYAEIALMEGKDEFGHSWEDFKHFVLDEQLKEKGE